MAEQYNISIVIEGKDKASRPIGGVSSALKDMGKIAGGIIGAQVLTSIARGIANMGREALNAVASFERIGLALQNLAAREFIALNHADRFVQTMREQAGWTDQQANRYAHLRQQYEQLSGAMAKMAEQGRQNTPYYQGLIKRQGQIEKQIKALIPNYDSLSDVMKKAAFGGVKMADALRAAIKPSKELMKWSIRLAIHSPFDTKSVVNAMKTAMAYGFTMREAQKLTTTMIDFAAATGASKDVMNRIALALGQVKAKGRLMGQEILQLVNAGVPVNDILAEMGVNLQDLKKKGVGAQEFIAAFTKYMQTNFAGAADRQTRTWAGLINTFGDLKQLGLKALFEGIFGAMEPVVAQFSNWMQDKGLDRLKTMGERLGEITRLLVGLATADISSLSGLFYKWKIPQATQERIFRIVTGIGRLFDAIKGKRSFASLLDFSGVASRASGLMEFMAHLRDLGDVMVIWWGKVWEKMQEVIAWTQENLAPVFEDALSRISAIVEIWAQLMGDNMGKSSKMLDLLAFALKALLTAATVVFDGIITVVQVALTWLGGILQAATLAWQGDWSGAWEVIKATLAQVWGEIEGFLNTALQAILSAAGTSLERLKTVWSNNWNMFLAILNAIADKILAKLNEWAGGLLDILNGLPAKMKTLGQNIMQGLWDGLRSIYDSLKQWFEETIGALIEKIKAITGISSPSKVFAEIGRYWMLGLAQGIQQNAGLPAAALAGAAGGAAQMVTNQTWNVHVHGGNSMDESDIVRGVMVAAWLAGGA